jgi:hypothetical protein
MEDERREREEEGANGCGINRRIAVVELRVVVAVALEVDRLLPGGRM